VVIQAPGKDRAVGPEGQTVLGSSGNGGEIVSGRGSGLTVVIQAPGKDRAVGPEGQTVLASSGDGGKVVADGGVLSPWSL